MTAWPISMPRRPGAAVLATALAVCSLSGCGQGSLTPLPETGTIARPLLSPAEQKKAIADLEARKRQLEADAARKPGQPAP